MAENEKRKPGRIPQVNNQLRISTILKYKDQILIVERGVATRVAGKDSKVWTDIAVELSNSVKPITLYNNVINNNYGLRSLLFENQTQLVDRRVNDISDQNLTVNSVDSSFNESLQQTPIKNKKSLRVCLYL